MQIFALAFLMGIWLCQMERALPPVNAMLFMLPALLLLLYTRCVIIQFGLVFILGYLWMLGQAHLILAYQLPLELAGQEVVLTGEIVGLPRYTATGLRVKMRVERMEYKDKVYPAPPLVSLQWYRAKGVELPALQPSEQWRWVARLERPHGFVNPTLPDYENNLFQQRIRATGSIRPKSQQPRLLAEASFWHVDRWRWQWAQTLLKHFGDSPHTGILIALTLGEQQWITPEQWEVIRHSGIAHLISISGLHVAILGMLVFAMTYHLWRWVGYFSLYMPALRAAVIPCLIITFVYALLAGFSVPTQRSFIMITVVMSGIFFMHSMSFFTVIAIGLMVVLLYDPLASLSVGFWLSFGAVFIIVYNSIGYRLDLKGIWRVKLLGFLQTQWAATLGLLPLTVAFFGYFSVIGVLANIVAIPCITFVVVPLALGGSFLGFFSMEWASVFLNFALFLLDFLWFLLDVFRLIPFGVFLLPLPSHFILMMALLGVFILLLPIGFPARWLGILWFLPLFFPRIEKPALGEIWFTLLDVGQGLATVVQTRNHVLVYDTGAQHLSGFNLGEVVVAPFLRRQGIDTLDMLMISHANNDHSGGMQVLLKQFSVNAVFSSNPAKLPPSAACYAGQWWQWDEVSFEVLHPPHGYRNQKTNNQSCVLHIKGIGGSILLTGDIEKAAEYDLLRSDVSLAADILQVPHHGSASSSSIGFINAVNPKFALFSVGYRNRFGHPRPEVKNQYQARGITVWQTDEAGAIEMRLGSDGTVSTALAREKYRRFWHD